MKISVASGLLAESFPGRAQPTVRGTFCSHIATTIVRRPGFAAEPVRLSGMGVDGVVLSVVNFKDEFPFFTARAPLLRQAGLRNS